MESQRSWLLPNRQLKVVLAVAVLHATPEIADGRVQLVVTSPPFLDVVDYEADNWLRCWFNGIDPEAVEIWQLRKEAEWQAHMTAVLTELERILKLGGHVAFEVGEVRGG